MPRARSTIAVSCLVLGLADLLYLDLAVAPSVLQPQSDRPALLAGAGAVAEPLLAQRRGSDGAGGEATAATPPMEPDPGAVARALDPELAAQTGAEPEPEIAAMRAVTAEPGRRLTEALTEVVEGGDDRDIAESEPLPDALPSEPVQVHFARDRATLSPRGRARLDRLAGWLAAEPGLRAVIHGHADRVGERLHNDQLSLRRAERVADYFESAGVARARMTVRAFGERRPFDRHRSTEADRRNRRVEIRVSPARLAPAAPAAPARPAARAAPAAAAPGAP